MKLRIKPIVEDDADLIVDVWLEEGMNSVTLVAGTHRRNGEWHQEDLLTVSEEGLKLFSGLSLPFATDHNKKLEII